MKKRILSALIAVALLFSVNVATTQGATPHNFVGDVYIISNGEKHIPVSNVSSGSGDGLAWRGAFMLPEHVFGFVEFNVSVETPTVFYADDFELIVDSEHLRDSIPIMSYYRNGVWGLFSTEYEILTNAMGWEYYEFELLGYSDDTRDLSDFSELYTLLQDIDDGEYVLMLHVGWASGNTLQSRHVNMQYGFRIIVGEDTVPKVYDPPIANGRCGCVSVDHVELVTIANRRICVNSTDVGLYINVTNEDVAKIADALPLLQNLELAGDELTDISPLAALTDLRWLNVNGEIVIGDVEPPDNSVSEESVLINTALAILRHVVDLPTAINVTVETHDFDGNGVVEIADALLVLREIVGL